jgi:hypothetical protein
MAITGCPSTAAKNGWLVVVAGEDLSGGAVAIGMALDADSRRIDVWGTVLFAMRS